MKNPNQRFLFAILSLLFFFCTLPAQGIIVNEASNGDSGSREYFEFVVVGVDAGDACGAVDLRGWIFDDNNGDFSGGPTSGEGIASGHARFANVAVWSSIPMGSIMLVYNPLDVNTSITLPPDPYDANGDSVYVIPLDNPNLEFCSQSPTTPSSSSDSYTCSTYLPFLATGAIRNWNSIQLRNAGDAAQTRMPNGAYFHGISYGSGGGLGTGGPDGIHIGNSAGDGSVFFLDNGVDSIWTNPANYSRDNVANGAETPGAPNSLANARWINQIRCTILPVSLTWFEAKAEGEAVVLNWATANESQNKEFLIERSGPEGDFEVIGREWGAGTSDQRHEYNFVDDQSGPVQRYYRLRQVDYDGGFSFSRIVGVTGKDAPSFLEQVYPNPALTEVNFRFSLAADSETSFIIELFDPFGKCIKSHSTLPWSEVNLPISDVTPGMYLYRVTDSKTGKMVSGKLWKD